MQMITHFLTEPQILMTLLKFYKKKAMSKIDWFTLNCMQANPDKFQAIAIGKRTASKNPSFDISNANIKCDDVVKLLGVNLDSGLFFLLYEWPWKDISQF